MNKKIKWAIPFAVLALSCGIAAGCKGGGHEHSYTEWGYNETQHWKQCPEDDEIDQSTKEDHNFIDGSCECGATQQTPPVTDVTVTNATTDTNGTVTLSKTTVKAGESVTVTVEPKAGYQLKSLTVNGANVFGAMTGNTYTFTAQENTTVVAVFEKIASSSVNAVITGKKYGVTGNSLTAGTTVTLSAEGRDDIATEIKADGDNLVIKVDEIAGDNWAVKVEGYVAATIIVPRDAEYTTAIALEYDLMENLKNTWGNSDSVDLSKQNEGKIKHTGGYVQWVSSKNSYESVAITATVGKGGFRQGVFIRFKGESYDDDKYVMVSKENSDKIGWCAMDGGSDYKGSPISPWDDKIKPLTKEDYELTLVRDGADIYFFVDGEFINKKTFSDYADKECYVGLFCTEATAMENSERTFEIAQASDFIEVSVTDETATDAHGTVTIDKHTATLNEQVTVTLNPENGYKIKDLKIDGVSVLSQMTGTSYKFTALKDTTVVAEFEEIKAVNSLELTVNAATGFETNGAEITLEQLGEKQTAVVGTNGKATFGSEEKPVATGTHNVYADFGGYKIKLGTVNVELSDSDDGTAKPVSVTLGFTGSGVEYADSVSAANPLTGELTYKLENANHGAYNNKYDIVDIEGGGYFATKVKFTNDGSLSVILRRSSDNKEIKYVVQNNNAQDKGDGSNFVFGLDDDGIANGIWDDGAFVSLAAYNDAFKGDGVWIVLGYDATTGELTSYIGTSLNSVRPLKVLKNITPGLIINGIGAGNWFSSSNDTATVTFKYGATMEAIGMAIENKVTVTASVNDEAMGTVDLDATDGKYFSDTQVNVTVTANAGYVLKSIKVGNGEAVTEGWTTDGNVYTYVFTVAATTTVVATFEALEVWESATLTLNGVAENTEVKLYDGVNTITAIAGANGVVTFTGDNKIGKKVYTVTVKNVVFNVDFTTESSIRKTIGTVTVDDFSARDNYNEGAKVIDMGAAKNSTEYAVTFNLKTTSTIEGWKQRWSILLINGNNNTTTGIGCIGMNNNVLTVWDAAGASPDDDGRNPVFKGDAKSIKFDELVHGANGVNMKVVRQGSKATMYFELEGEWIEMLTVTLGSGVTNLKFACSYGVEWQISDMAINYISEFDYLVNASIEGDAHGYKVSVAQTANAATVVIQTNDEKAAWSYFPNAITVNGTAIGFSTVTKESLGANRCKYTFTLNITENTDIVVTVGEGTKVEYLASVNDGTMGNIVCDKEADGKEYYWNDLCTFTVTAKEGYELESIVIGEGSDAITVTADGANKWTQNGKVYTYSYLVTGDIKVVANLKHTPVVTLNNVTVSIMNGTDKVDLGESINAKLDGDTDYSVILTKGADGTYTFGGTFLCGNYKLIVLGQNVGYSPVDVVIDENTAAVSVQYLLATATKYHHGNNNGMGECDFETLIEVDADTVKINTANVNGKPVDAFWCWNSSVPEVTLNVSEEVKNATNVTLEFNLKVANGNDKSPNNAFGIAMAGYKGVAISLWNINDDKIDLHELTGCKLGTDGWGYADTYAAFGWIETLAESANGVNIRVVREGAKITFYAQNTAIAEGEQWVKFFETTCDESAKTDIKFLGMGSDYTVDDISVTVNETSNEA